MCRRRFSPRSWPEGAVIRTRPLRAVSLATLAALAVACGKGRPAAPKEAPPDQGVVSVERVAARAGPSARAPVATTLPRGTALQIRRGEGDYYLVLPPSDGEVWVPAGTFERLSDRAARERRQEEVKGFLAQPGRIQEPCPILLAPELGAARWGLLEDGEVVEVILSEHDFFGLRGPGNLLAFVPARAVRLLPAPPGTPRPNPAAKGGVVPQIEPLFPDSGASTAPPIPSAVGPHAPAASPADELSGAGGGPLPSLPAGATAPVLVRREDPVYPPMAKKLRLSGDVTLRLVVEADGSTSRIEVVSGGKTGFGEAAVEAVRKWVYRPARIDGHAVAVWKIVRVRFSMEPEREAPND